jgi:hypothetical protein
MGVLGTAVFCLCWRTRRKSPYSAEYKDKHAHAKRPWARPHCLSPRPGYTRPPATRERLKATLRLAVRLAMRPPAACCASPDDVLHGELQNGEVRADDELAGRGNFGAAPGLRAKQAVSQKHDV